MRINQLQDVRTLEAKYNDLQDNPVHKPTAATLLEEQIALNVPNTFKFGMLNNYCNFIVI